MQTTMHFKVAGKRPDFSIDTMVEELDELLKLLERARSLVKTDLHPA
jgi:hypothetical protein